MAHVDAELRKALDLYKSGGAPALSADVRKDWQIASPNGQTMPTLGLQQYNLFPTALTLYPVLTPLRNMLPRLQGRGRQSEFKAILKVGNGPLGDALSGVFGSEGNSGSKIDPTIEDIVAVYRSMKQAAAVSFEQQWEGQGYIDTKATAVVNLLRQFMINEERALLFGLNSGAALTTQFSAGAVGVAAALPTIVDVAPGASTVVNGVTYTAPSANSSLGTGNLFVQYRASTGMGASQNSAEQSVATTLNHYVLLIFPARAGFPINSYQVFSGATTGSEKAGTQLFVAGATAAASTVLPADLSTGFPVFVGAVGAGAAIGAPADASASSLAYNGLFAQLYGSNQNGAGLGQAGASVVHANGAIAATGSGTNSLESLLSTMWNNAFADPKWALMNEAESRAISRATLGAGTPYFVNVPEDKLNAATAAFRVSRMTNPVTGSEVEIKVHPYIGQGSIIVGSDAKPQWYVPESIPATIAVDAVQDYTEIDYPPKYATDGSGDSWVVQVMNLTTFKCFIPAIFGIMDNIVKS